MNDQTPLPAPGWYTDPAAPDSALRYWDGATWTEHTHPVATADPVASTPAGDGAAAEQDAIPPAADAGEQASETAPTAPDTDVPSAPQPGADDAEPAEPEPAPEPSTTAAPAEAEPATDRLPPTAPAEAGPANAEPYAAAPRQPDPYAQPFHQAGPPPPAAPWAQQGPGGNPYQQPRAAQYGAPAAAPTSRKGLWIGLGIGGGVFLLLVIGVVIAVVAFFASIGDSMREFQPAPLPSYDSGAPGGGAPEIDGEIHGMGEPFVIPDLAGTGEGWEVTVVDFSAEAAEAASAAPGNKAFAVLVEATNLGGVALDPYFAMTPTFVGDDGLEYTDFGMIEPGLIDVDEVEPGATTRFTATFEVPEDLEDAGTLVLYDGFMDETFAVAVG